MASVTANSRMIYAFSRDNALPGSKLWHKINPKTRTPTNSVWLGVALSAIVGALSLYQKGGYSTAFFALTGICVIGLYISYAIPIYLRLTNPDFEVGPWNLKGHAQARRLDRAGVDRVHHGAVLRPALLPLLGVLERQQRVRARVLQAEQLQLHRSTDHAVGPGHLGLLGASAARSGSRARSCRARQRSWLAVERELDALEHGTL